VEELSGHYDYDYECEIIIIFVVFVRAIMTCTYFFYLSLAIIKLSNSYISITQKRLSIKFNITI